MTRLTAEQIEKIEALNGTYVERYEYMDAISEILSVDCSTVKWNKNHMKTVALDDQHILDITTKTIKGHRYVVRLDVVDGRGRTQLVLERKRGVWVNAYDREWYTLDGNYKEGAEQLKDAPYRG